MNELKPCPFCGGKAEVVFCDEAGQPYSNWYSLNRRCLTVNAGKVRCKKCKIETLAYTTADYAVRKWNRRVDNET